MNDSYNAEYEVHASTWRGFTRLMTYGTAVVVLILLGLLAVFV